MKDIPHTFIPGPGLNEAQCHALLMLVHNADYSAAAQAELNRFGKERNLCNGDTCARDTNRRIKELAKGTLTFLSNHCGQ